MKRTRQYVTSERKLINAENETARLISKKEKRGVEWRDWDYCIIQSVIKGGQ